MLICLDLIIVICFFPCKWGNKKFRYLIPLIIVVSVNVVMLKLAELQEKTNRGVKDSEGVAHEH